MRVRRANLADIDAIIELERLAPLTAHWSRQQYEKLFPTTETQLRSGWFVWVAEDHFEVEAERTKTQISTFVALLVAHRVDEEWELENVVVKAAMRRQGVGKMLMDELIAFAHSHHGTSIFLEVRESNEVARALYRKFGFVETGVRRNYYAGPPEAAVLCRLNLC